MTSLHRIDSAVEAAAIGGTGAIAGPSGLRAADVGPAPSVVAATHPQLLPLLSPQLS